MTDKASDILDLLEGFLKRTEPPKPERPKDTTPTSESEPTPPSPH